MESLWGAARALGKNELDVGAKPFVKEIVAIDKNGSVDYKFKSPADNQIRDKSSFFVSW